MRFAITAFLALTGAGAQPGPPATPMTAPAQPASAAARSDPNRLICQIQQESGTLIGHRRVCMTRVQWDDARRRNRMAIERLQTSTRVAGQ
jgi:hypothetical protein